MRYQPSSSRALMAVLATAFALSALPAYAQSSAPERLQGKAPTNPVINLDADDESLASILTEISDDAKWDLVIAAPESLTRAHLTLKLHGKRAEEALAMVLSAGGLRGEFSGDVLTVRAGPGAPAAAEGLRDETYVPSERHRRGRDRNERVAFGEAIVVERDETVRSVVAIGGPLTVRGHVREDAVVIGNDLVAEPGAIIDGDAVAIGGKLDLREGASVRGDRVNIGGPFGGIARVVARAAHGEVSAATLLALSVLSTLVRGLIIFVVALLLLTFVPERVQRVRAYLLAHPGSSALAGVAMLIATVPLIVLLCITIIGIPLVPVLVVALLLLGAMGLTALLTWLGDRLPIFAGSKTPFGALLIGLALLVLVDLVPVLGTLVVFVASLVAAGAALLARFGSEPKTPASTAGGAA
jgi:hypothetical protein